MSDIVSQIESMFHKVKSVTSLSDYRLSVQFCEGVTKLYNVSTLINSIPAFREFEKHSELFEDVDIDVGGCGIIWHDDLDLSCDELWEHGEAISTSFTTKR